MTTRSEIDEGQAWARCVLGRPAQTGPSDEQRRAEIRREVEREIDAAMLEGRAARDREQGKAQFEQSMRHARAVTATRDRDPSRPVGTAHRAPDGTVWVRKS